MDATGDLEGLGNLDLEQMAIRQRHLRLDHRANKRIN
jgi:hypothetical protein